MKKIALSLLISGLMLSGTSCLAGISSPRTEAVAKHVVGYSGEEGLTEVARAVADSCEENCDEEGSSLNPMNWSGSTQAVAGGTVIAAIAGVLYFLYK